METRIAMIAPMAGDQESEKGRQVVEGIFARNANKLKEEGTVVDYILLHRGIVDTDHLAWEALNVWNMYELFEAVRNLKKEDYDAVVLHCYSDPHLTACRQIMDIPVVGVVQTSMVMATMMGAKFGVITFAQPIIDLIDELALKYGFKDRAVRTRSMDTTNREFIKSYFDAHDLIDRFTEFARQSIRDGAEVLVPG
jgi:Asp/Glu/hydantoin racemase